MHRGLPSFTAVVVAGARALASSTDVASCDAGDRAAYSVLPRSVALGLLAISNNPLLAPVLPRAIAAASLGMVDHLALRTRAIDSALVDALKRGVDQLVILGAGLDTRAHRMPELRQARVFEVDQVDTQAQKRKRSLDLPITAEQLTYIPVDFARDSLGDRLREHGHDDKRPTFWIWEGVVPYLPPSAIVETVRTLRARAAPGSELAVTYVPKSMLLIERARAAVDLGFRLIGEPLKGLIDREELAALLRDNGFEVITDTSTRDWRKQFGHRKPVGIALTYERLALAKPR